MTKGEWLVVVYGVLLVITLHLLLGCADHRPTCYDNPRNMSCMTAGELDAELNK